MLKLYNTLTQQIERFEPLTKNQVSMYICGPTVYGDIHLGNARPIIFFDVVKRYLRFVGYDVLLVSNITDVDDKIIEKAKAIHVSEKTLTDEYTKHFIDMTLALGSILPDEMPKATAFVPHMIRYIQDLIDGKHAYVKPGGVYFRVKNVSDYGILSKQNIEELSQGVRVTLEEEKEDPRDFTIWKTTEDGMNFDSPWGRGRPGWHTECAVMNHEIFGAEIDIHGGGADLKFPHHENEIAQTVVHDHHHLAKYWMHVARLDLNEEKMSKSLGNIILVKDLIEVVDPLAFRLLMINHHYRQPIHYSDDLMTQFEKEYDKIKRTLKKAFLTLSLEKVSQTDINVNYLNQFKQHMDDDLNIPNVMSLVYEMIKELNKEKEVRQLSSVFYTLKMILDILGIMPRFYIEDQTLILYRNWADARENKDYDRADSLRKQLVKQGWM
jgi:cysteinyl-tRNA synthetase